MKLQPSFSICYFGISSPFYFLPLQSKRGNLLLRRRLLPGTQATMILLLEYHPLIHLIHNPLDEMRQQQTAH
jgi:hypothetical protein